jgi:transcriptional regulator with XRE-family HTH domain
MTTIEIFKKMLDWIYDNQLASNQTEVARKIGMNPVSMSKIHNGKTKSVKQETLRAVNAAYGNVFNHDWLRGESDVMLLADLTPDTTTDVTAIDESAQVPTDLTPQLIASKDEIITILRSQLADKDALIESKERYIKILQQQIFDLHNLKRSQDDVSLVPVVTEDLHK